MVGERHRPGALLSGADIVVLGHPEAMAIVRDAVRGLRGEV